MNNREMLELAAKAAGVNVYSYIDCKLFGIGINTGELDVPLWNPLENDGEAFRLAVQLGMLVEFSKGYQSAQAFGSGYVARTDGLFDPFAAARHAIVRAAAEVGKAMP